MGWRGVTGRQEKWEKGTGEGGKEGERGREAVEKRYKVGRE